jgi:uncharacterized protein YbaP (TraB family)
MALNREKQAMAFVKALTAYEKAAEPIVEFDRMLDKWKDQRTFAWAGVKLVMTDEVAQVLRAQLAQNLETLRQELNIARDALND